MGSTLALAGPQVGRCSPAGAEQKPHGSVLFGNEKLSALERKKINEKLFVLPSNGTKRTKLEASRPTTLQLHFSMTIFSAEAAEHWLKDHPPGLGFGIKTIYAVI